MMRLNGAELYGNLNIDCRSGDNTEQLEFLFLGLYFMTLETSFERYQAVGLLLQRVPNSAAVLSRAGICEMFDTSIHPEFGRPDFEEQPEISQNSIHFVSSLAQQKKISCLSEELFDPDYGYDVIMIWSRVSSQLEAHIDIQDRRFPGRCATNNIV
jgi:hypothetical protein